jgi:hypothetical protein
VLITRPEESYRMWCVCECDREASSMRRPWTIRVCCAMENKTHQFETNVWDIYLMFSQGCHFWCNCLVRTLVRQLLSLTEVTLLSHFCILAERGSREGIV